MSGHVGMDAINRQAFDSLSASFGQFVADGHVKDSTIVKTGTGINALRAGSGDFRGNVLFRSASQIEENNAVRNAFLKSVSDVYGGEDHIPESVKVAMKASDFDGKGHPLTARRIRATMDAIRMDIDHKKIADVVESQEWLFGGDYVIDLKQTRPDLVNVLVQYSESLANDMLDVMKTTILPDIEKGKAPSVAKMRRFLETMVEGEKTETRKLLDGHDRNINTAEIISCCWNTAFNKVLVRNEALMKFFFCDSKAAAEATRNMDQALEDIRESLPMDNPETAPKRWVVNTKVGVFSGELFSNRHFVVAGLSPKEIHSLLVKMADEQGSAMTEKKKWVLNLEMTLSNIRLLPNAEQKAVANQFLREIGQSILDGTIRPRKSSSEDALYDVVIKRELPFELQECVKNCRKNAKAGNHDLPETIMGSPELDEQLKQRLTELKAQI